MPKRKRGRVPGTPARPPTFHSTGSPDDPDARVYALTPDGVQDVPIVDTDEEMEVLAICPGGCHLLARFPGHGDWPGGEMWAEVREDAREHWARQGLPVRQPS